MNLNAYTYQVKKRIKDLDILINKNEGKKDTAVLLYHLNLERDNLKKELILTDPDTGFKNLLETLRSLNAKHNL